MVDFYQNHLNFSKNWGFFKKESKFCQYTINTHCMIFFSENKGSIKIEDRLKSIQQDYKII